MFLKAKIPYVYLNRFLSFAISNKFYLKNLFDNGKLCFNKCGVAITYKLFVNKHRYI